MSDCNCCCEPYNKSTRKCISCPNAECEYSACTSCTKKYLLSTTTAHCMNCKKTWDRPFLIKNFTQTFISKEYKKHQKNLFLEGELSKIPETMNAVAAYQKERELNDKITEKNKEIYKYREKIRKLEAEKSRFYLEIRGLKGGKIERKQFIMPCSNENCRGFLSSQYKCDVCNTYTCPKCMVNIGIDKNIPHTCNEDDVKSTELIKKDTKPCPNCGTRISKVDGCDQMWCTECHKAFSWRTGKIDNGVIHNPHFYQFQNNTGFAVRNPLDVPCGGLKQAWEVRREFLDPIKTIYRIHKLHRSNLPYHNDFIEMYNEMMTRHRKLSEISQYIVPSLRTQIRTKEDDVNERVNYILNIITKEQLSNSTTRRILNRQENIELLHIWEIFTTYGIEFFTYVCDESKNITKKIVENVQVNDLFKLKNTISAKMEEFERLKEYCNDQFANICASYKHQVPYIHWKYRHNNIHCKQNLTAKERTLRIKNI